MSSHSTQRSGNGCGHNREMPRRYGMARFKSRPKILEQIKKRAHSFNSKSQGWRHYVPGLKALRIQQKHTTRLQRSESRHALSWLVGVVADFLDLETMAIGHWDKTSGLFIPATLKDLQQSLKTACNADEDFSYSRVKRHFRLLRDAGYITCQYRSYEAFDENGEAVMRQDAAIKYLTPKFFREMGMDLGSKKTPSKFAKQLQRDRQRSIERNRSIRRQAGVEWDVGDLAKRSAGKARLWLQTTRKKASLASKQQYNAALYELMNRYPELTPANVREILGPPPS